MQKLLAGCVVVYIFFYAFEGVVRYFLHMGGADSFIFARDALIILPLLILLGQRFLRRETPWVFWMYVFVIGLHGLVMVMNIGSVVAVIYGAKMLITVLIGALIAPHLLKPNRFLLIFFFLLWAVSCIGIALDKYFVTMPWMGIEATIGDVKVDVSRDWQISGEDKRAAGFMRSSINAATIMPILALILLIHIRSFSLKWLIALITIPALYWTTQKGPIIAYIIALGAVALQAKKPIPGFNSSLVLTLIALCILLPVVLPGYTMPSAEGVFSFSSFYMRIEDMWPRAWDWIARREAFPFGVGLGGISGAQRLYARDEVNDADNLFVLMYAYFGIMSFVYFGVIAYLVLKTPNRGGKEENLALSIVVFLIGYGCVISLLEDQMASLFLGAALTWLAEEIQKAKQQPTRRILVTNGATKLLPAVHL